MERNNLPEEESGVKTIAADCLDSPGYLLFSAHLTSERDENGYNKIQFQYRRYHFTIEDAKRAIEELKMFVDEEIKELYAED